MINPYIAKTWVDRIVEFFNRRTITDTSDPTDVRQVYVSRDEGTITEPGDVFDAETMNNMESRINAAFAATAEAIEEAAGVNIAEQYETTSTYNEGDYVVYAGDLYKCITDISTPEAWTPAHWTRCTITEEITEEEGFTLSDTLLAGNTSLTFSDARITANSHVFPWASVWGIVPVSISVSTGAITITFQAQQSDIEVEVKIT